MISGNAKWYALYLRSRYEKKVYTELSKKSIETFLPLIEETHLWSDRRKKVMEPLFRGYVFVKTDLRNKENILITKGVVRFVSANHIPSWIPESQISWLQRIVSEYKDIQREKYVNIGEHVRVNAGPLAGIEGIVARKHGVSRVVVSITAIEQSISVEIPDELLEIIRGN